MWKVREHKNKAAKVLDKAPQQVQEKYEYWKELIGRDGPMAVRKIPGFHDEALKGDWKGCRSSNLNKQYRVIYSIHRKEVMVCVEQIGPHDY